MDIETDFECVQHLSQNCTLYSDLLFQELRTYLLVLSLFLRIKDSSPLLSVLLNARFLESDGKAHQDYIEFHELLEGKDTVGVWYDIIHWATRLRDHFCKFTCLNRSQSRQLLLLRSERFFKSHISVP